MLKFICNKTELSEAISNVSKAVASKSTLPVLEGIKVKVTPNKIELTGYNLEIGIRTSVNCITEDTGEFVVSSRLFSEFTRRMSGDEITFVVNDSLVINISVLFNEFISASNIFLATFPSVLTFILLSLNGKYISSFLNFLLFKMLLYIITDVFLSKKLYNFVAKYILFFFIFFNSCIYTVNYFVLSVFIFINFP